MSLKSLKFAASRFLSTRTLALAGLLSLVSLEASARAPVSVPEPGMMSLLGLSLLAGIITYRLKGPRK